MVHGRFSLRRSSLAALAFLSLSAGLSLLATPANAQFWVGNGANGNWSTAANWNPGVPTSGAGTTIQFLGTGSGITTLTQNLGTFTLTTLAFRSTAPGYTINQAGGSTLNFSGSGFIIQDSAANQVFNLAVTIASGSSLDISELIGGDTATPGSLTFQQSVSGGTYIRNQGNFAVILNGGGSSGILGAFDGTTTVGNGSTFTATNAVQVANGASFIVNGGSDLTVANDLTTYSGSTTISGSGTTATATTVAVGVTSDGITPGTGQVIVSNNAVLNATSVIGLGYSISGDSGTLLVQSGGDVVAGNVVVGAANGANGTLTVTGTGSTLTATGAMVLGNLGGSATNNVTFTNNAVGAITGILGLNTTDSNVTVNGGATLAAGSLLGTGASNQVFLTNPNASTKALTIGSDNTNQTYFGTIENSGGNAGGIRKIGTGTQTLGNAGNTYSGGTAIDGGTIAIAGSGSLGANVAGNTLSFDGGTLRLLTTITLDATRPITLNAGGGTIDTQSFNGTYNSAISGAGGLTKTGTGTLFLGGTNTYTGTTNINGGILHVSSDSNLGASTADITFNGGTLRLGGSFAPDTARAITLNAGGGTIDTNGFDTTISQAISGVGTLTKAGTGTLTLGGTNTYSGNTNLNGGTLEVSSNANLGNANNDVAFNGGTLRFGGVVTTTAGRDFAVNAGGGTIDTQSFDTTHNGTLSGSGTLVKQGTGTLILNGSSSYSGTIQSNQADVAVNGTMASTDISLASGAGFLGTGTVDTITMASGSALAPGSSLSGVGDIATLTATSLTWSPSSALLFELGAPGTNDLLSLSTNNATATNSLTFNGTGTYLFGFSDAGGLATGVSYQLIRYDEGFSTYNSSLHTLQGVAYGNGFDPDLTPTFSIEIDGTGSEYLTVSFDIIPAPEPGTFGLLAVGLVTGAGIMARKRRVKAN